VIEAVEGDQVRIYVTNRLPAPTTVHWHGFILPNGMDGVSGLTQKPIPPGETWVYEFKLVQSGTYMYHSHHDTMTQEGLGLTGMFVIHPRRPVGPPVDRDFAIMLHEWRIDAGSRRPNPNEMNDFNILTMNAKVFPHTEPLVVRTGQRVRIRFGNLSAMDHHPIHLHGYEFYETGVDGYRIPENLQPKKVTVLVGVGQTRDIEFVADKPGDWAFHCHMTHHVMNQMGHDLPNMIGVDPSKLSRVQTLLPDYMVMGQTGMRDMTKMHMPLPENSIPMEKGLGGVGTLISFGGMANVLKVRDHISRYEDPGWYQQPAGTMARKASTEELKRDHMVV
jgi:FtsP/CotA-like multicopper oxidase with cupredoxin domain